MAEAVSKSSVLRRRRRDLDLSQNEVARLSGLHRTVVSRIERGERLPPKKHRKGLARALQLTLTELEQMLTDERPVPPQATLEAIHA